MSRGRASVNSFDRSVWEELWLVGIFGRRPLEKNPVCRADVEQKIRAFSV